MTTETKNKSIDGRLRVLVVAPSFDILGGQAVQAARLVARLRDEPAVEIGLLAINPRLPGVLRKLQGVKYLRTIVTSIAYVASLLLRIPQYDVIHIFSASYFSFVLAPTPAILISKAFGKRVLLNYHSGEAEDHLRRWPSAVGTLRLADAIVVPSDYLVNIFSRFGLRAAPINNIIDFNDFTFRERKSFRPRFLTNRNLEKHYGVDVVLRAFAAIQNEFPEARLVVGGDGSQRTALEQLARHLKLKHTQFAGHVAPDMISQQYDGADIYLNGSRIDNQPLSILEAFACGLPVVTTNAGGIPDMVRHRDTGLIVPCDDYETLAKEAKLLISDNRLATSIAAHARSECEQYSWDTVRDQWLRTYSNLASTKREKNRPHQTNGSWSKVRAMSFVEVRVRLTQKVFAWLERHGWSSLAKLPSDTHWPRLFTDESAAHDLRSNSSERKFFAAFDDPQQVVCQLRRRWPEAEAQIIAKADRVLAKRFDLLGFEALDFGDPIDWRREPFTGKSTPLIHWSRINYLDSNVAGDKKITWELNRHQYFATLGQAYWLTNDENYARAFAEAVNSWMDANPPKLGINWVSSLEIAFRSISWLWAFQYFKDSPSIDAQTHSRALKFLYLNARHLETYLSLYFSPNTHLTGEALGLFYLGTLLPEFKEAQRWRDLGQAILLEQLHRQVRPDGVYFEESSYYHRYTTDFYLHFLMLATRNKIALPAVVSEKLELLLDHLMYITLPDGNSPLFGDDDGGRLVSLEDRSGNDFRATLSTGAALFQRADYKFVAGEFAAETLWLLGVEGASCFDQIPATVPAECSKQFPDGGYHVMRDSWQRDANYLLFDCGPHGADNCGHAHADALSIQLAVKGQTMLVDPGTFTYTGSSDMRDLFRSSAAHNVLLIDGQSSSVPAGPFSWQTIADCALLRGLKATRFDFVEGSHNGYAKLNGEPVHRRAILFLKGDYWVMRDSVTSNSIHQLELRFHFAPRVDICLTDKTEVVATCGSASMQLVAMHADGSWSTENGWFSECYGKRESAPVCAFSAQKAEKNTGETELVTFLLPREKRSTRFEVREVEAIGGRAFQISRGSRTDFILFRNSQSERVETVKLASDFEITWVRFEQGESSDLSELVLINGRQVELESNCIVKSETRIDFLTATRAGERFRVETSEGSLDLNFPIANLERVFAEAEHASFVR